MCGGVGWGGNGHPSLCVFLAVEMCSVGAPGSAGGGESVYKEGNNLKIRIEIQINQILLNRRSLRRGELRGGRG